jgi:predicted DNA-binding transcriptional regulator AlpA
MTKRAFPQPAKSAPVAERIKPTAPIRILSKKQLLETKLNNASAVSLWSWIKDDHFPPAIIIGPEGGGHRTKIGWIESEVDAWLVNRPRRVVKGAKP